MVKIEEKTLKTLYIVNIKNIYHIILNHKYK